MNLYFENSKGKLRIIANIDNSLDDKQAIEAAQKEIRKFCDDRNFKIYYMRIWQELCKGTPMLKFDVGSHTEFFYLDIQISMGNNSKRGRP